jgi:hypothetical protein
MMDTDLRIASVNCAGLSFYFLRGPMIQGFCGIRFHCTVLSVDHTPPRELLVLGPNFLVFLSVLV